MDSLNTTESEFVLSGQGLFNIKILDSVLAKKETF